MGALGQAPVQPPLRAHLVLADTADNRAVDKVDIREEDMGMRPVGVVVDMVALEVVVHSGLHLQVAQVAAGPQQPDSDATCCRNLSTARIFLTDPVDRERRCIALRRLGRK